MASLSLEEIFDNMLKLERRPVDFCRVMEDKLRDHRSREVMNILKEQLNKKLSLLAKVDSSDYRYIEFIKSMPDYHSTAVLPELEISRKAVPEEVFHKLLEYEEQLLAVYRHFRDVLVYEKSKELFDMLIQLKTAQVKNIRALLDSYDLAV